MLRDRCDGVSPTRFLEAAAIFSSHGLADAASTVLAVMFLGVGVEANPVMAVLLEMHVFGAAGIMLSVVAVSAAGYVAVAEALDLSSWYALTVSAVGVLIAALNVLAVVLVTA